MGETTLQTLADGRFDKEPLKKGLPDWSLNPSHLIIHLFYNVLKEKVPRKKGGKLPSVDADSLEKMKHPIADRMLEYRSEGKVLQSYQNSVKFVQSSDLFARSPISYGMKAVFKYLVEGFDGVERIFAVAKESIPLTLDKGARKSFKVPGGEVPLDSLKPEVRKLVEGLRDE